MKKALYITLSLVIIIIISLFLLHDKKPDYIDGSYKNDVIMMGREKVKEKISNTITYTNASKDMISVELPFPGAVTGKDFSVIGEARGMWFFEASFPVELLDKDGKMIAQGIARANGEWMTENFVPFKADIKAPESYIGSATLVLKKDNPSGLPEHDASILFPITVEY